jgi:hypothetical protein
MMCTSPRRGRLPDLIGTAAALSLLANASDAAAFSLMPSPQTVHIGYFTANLKPVLSIDSGDTVTIETSSFLEPELVEQSGVEAYMIASGC